MVRTRAYGLVGAMIPSRVCCSAIRARGEGAHT